MKKYLLMCLLCCSAVILLNFMPKSFAMADQDGATEKDITILFTHDLHDNLLPIKVDKNGTVTSLGGFARLQSAINAEKKLDENALLVDGGDYSMGTPFQTIFQSDSPELRIMGQMGYEAVTLGNHEFDYRASGLADSLNVAKNSKDKLPEIVQSNMLFPEDDNGNLTPSLAAFKEAMNSLGKDYTIIEKNNIKIGVFGLMGPEAKSMAPMSEVTFSDYIKEAKRVVKLLKEQENADLIICLSHTGTSIVKKESEDEILAKKVPGIDVIISGHSHTQIGEPLVIGNTMIGSCGEYGQNLGVIKISQQTDDKWTLKNYKLVEINESIPEDTEIADKVSEFKTIVQEKYFDQFQLEYDEVMATSPSSFPSVYALTEKSKEYTLGNLITDSYIYAVRKAEGENYTPIAASVVPAGTIRGSLLAGKITTAEAFSISSLGIGADKMAGYPLISVYLTGKELKTICEVDASVAPLMSEAQLFISGLNFTFHPNRMIFNKVTDSYLKDFDGKIEKIEDKKLYRVIAGLYSAQMLSVVGEKSYGILSIVPKKSDGMPITDFEEQIIYRTENGVKSEVKEWYALVDYLQSFEKAAGISKIPAHYYQIQGRKTADSSKSLAAILRNPNGFAYIVYGIITSIFLLIVTMVLYVIRKKKRQKSDY